MHKLSRIPAVLLRRFSEAKLARKLPQQRALWESDIAALPPACPLDGTVALVRLDDIGDYLLWRNCLPAYRAFFAGRPLILIGNKVWQPLFETLDAACADRFIPLDKGRYLNDAAYRNAFWAGIRAAGIEQIICPSRTRPLLLDDCIALASGAPVRIAVQNNFPFASWNRISDAVYTRLLPGQEGTHEFYFNRWFTECITGPVTSLPARMSLPVAGEPQPRRIVCFIGASAKSKRWPAGYWIALVRLLSQAGFEPVLSGGPAESELAATISAAVPVTNLTATGSLIQTLELIAGSGALITGDTMAAHAGVGLSVPTIIIANGVNAARFVAYGEAGIQGVSTLYTEAYRNASPARRKRFTAVTKDMLSIRPEQVMQALLSLLTHTRSDVQDPA
ncbi:glycosyltransferase family 9 protein [Rurimicrobium arvi]|uniref:ADP-heptose:LPS heptosyltransferase n=1 Tax=Rurimicrobium arvi TaxID=2049916 RepID=A0ABP8MZS1_9BACT